MNPTPILIFIFFSVLNSIQSVKCQESCHNCDYDSLKKILATTKLVKAEKVKLLTLLIDKNPLDSSITGYVKQLTSLTTGDDSIDLTGYNFLVNAASFRQQKQCQKSLDVALKAVELFDKKKKKIPQLLSDIRILYNLLNKQEARYKYYKEKLDYYLVNGPIENVAVCYHGIAGYYLTKANYNLAISNYLRAADIFKHFSNRWYENEIAVCGDCYVSWGNLDKANYYLNYALELLSNLKDKSNKSFLLTALSSIQLKQQKHVEAMKYADEALAADSMGTTSYPITLLQRAFIYIEMKKPDLALPILNNVKIVSDSFSSNIYSSSGYLELDYACFLYSRQIKRNDSAEMFLQMALQKAVESGSNELQLKYLRVALSFYGAQNRFDSLKKYIGSYFQLSDSMEQQQNAFKVAQYESEQKEIEQIQNINILKQERAIQEATIHQRSLVLWISLAALIVIVGVLIFLYRQFNISRKTLQKLQTAQKQLIQSEKMASLGELTAGVAHEIQNPLNFINNFSEVGKELLDEMKTELNAGKAAAAIEISNDLIQTLEKINHHGKRADAIVKGMLQHSRSSSGTKEPTDINALADEYLRLSYHGLRAKDKSFNADFKTDFDKTADKIEVIPQDIGRVLLNLYNNAFYAVNEKRKTAAENYKPAILVQTKKLNNKIEIRVEDNGNGIPKSIVEKIFQPFFTTKPTGEGTGLGLSLSYDIITKGHGGEMKVESRENDGAGFTISLPVV